MTLYQLYHPEVFQGNLKKSHYFEGWYFKQVSSDFSSVLAIIPGISLAGEPHSFIQVIDGSSGETHYIDFSADSFIASKRKLDIRIEKNHFTREGCELSIHRSGLDLEGSLQYINPERWPRTPLAPGIMGWYSFVPYMECYHGVVSIDHRVQGNLNYQGEHLDFNHGRGYIEKDWGTSMPESWIWLHANTFESAGTSVMLSVAKIPWRGHFFIGFIGFILYQGLIYRFMTYNRTQISSINLDGQDFHIRLKNKKFTFEMHARQKKAGKLKAPVHGLMERYIKESVDSEAEVILKNSSGQVLFHETATKAGMEIVGNTDELLAGSK